MSDITNFREVLAKKTQDSTKWTVLDCLKRAVEIVESGEQSPQMVYIAFAESDENARYFNYMTAGAKTLETQGLLSKHLHNLLGETVDD